jgi:hypothetical protein
MNEHECFPDSIYEEEQIRQAEQESSTHQVKSIHRVDAFMTALTGHLYLD